MSTLHAQHLCIQTLRLGEHLIKRGDVKRKEVFDVTQKTLILMEVFLHYDAKEMNVERKRKQKLVIEPKQTKNFCNITRGRS